MDETNILLYKIFERMDIHDSKMDRLIDDVSVLKSDVSVLKSDVSDLKSDVSVLKSDVSDLKSDVSVLKSDVSELKETQNHHEKMFEILIKGQEKQNSILKSLALRSIEQETEIDALKWFTSK